MNPLVLNNRDALERALSTTREYARGWWGPAIPIHTWVDLLKAAWLVLRGKAFVIDVEHVLEAGPRHPRRRHLASPNHTPTRGGRSVMR